MLTQQSLRWVQGLVKQAAPPKLSDSSKSGVTTGPSFDIRDAAKSVSGQSFPKPAPVSPSWVKEMPSYPRVWTDGTPEGSRRGPAWGVNTRHSTMPGFTFDAVPASSAERQYYLQRKLHGMDLRTDAYSASSRQGFSGGMWPASGEELLRQRLNGQAIPVRRHWSANYIGPNVRLADPGQINWFDDSPEMQQQFARLGGYPAILNHEAEHMRQATPDREPSWWQAVRGKGPRYSGQELNNITQGDLETAPSLADLAFIARQHRMETGQPLDYTVELLSPVTATLPTRPFLAKLMEDEKLSPYEVAARLFDTPLSQQTPEIRRVTRREGISLPVTHLEDWVSDQGYFDEGRSMQELLQTPQGMALVRWLRGDHLAPDIMLPKDPSSIDPAVIDLVSQLAGGPVPMPR